jgi:Zn-dependent protease
MLMEYEFWGIRFSNTELWQLLISTLCISFAFSLALYRVEIFSTGFSYDLIFLFNALVIVGPAFILHEELGHKVMAQRNGCWAEFRTWPEGLILTLMMAFLSFGRFVFAAPGAVVISQVRKMGSGFSITYLSKENIGKIAVAGSVVNILLALIFTGAYIFTGISILSFAASVNAWLAAFNMLPFGPLDGNKVISWNKYIWIAIMGTAAAMIFLIPM